MSERSPLCPICERPIKTEIRSQASPTQELRVPTVCGDRHHQNKAIPMVLKSGSNQVVRSNLSRLLAASCKNHFF
jgi:hypothetical protein